MDDLNDHLHREEGSNIKKVYLHHQKSEETKTPLFVKKQSVLNSKCTFEDLSDEFQLSLLKEIEKEENEGETIKFTLQEINKKIYGYKSQDLEKNLTNTEKFVDFAFVIKKLVQCELCCFYCRKPTMLLYEYVREPRQWTLERIDNAFGHNKDNIEIACLSCNIGRRTMYHERYIFTKQLKITKMEDI